MGDVLVQFKILIGILNTADVNIATTLVEPVTTLDLA